MGDGNLQASSADSNPAMGLFIRLYPILYIFFSKQRHFVTNSIIDVTDRHTIDHYAVGDNLVRNYNQSIVVLYKAIP